MGGNIWVDDALKALVQARAVALSDPEESIIVSERAALADMLSDQHEREYRRRRGEQRRDA